MARPAGSLATLGAPPEPSEPVELRLAAEAPERLQAPLTLVPIELEREARPSWPTLAALAIVTGLGALGLGAWAVVEEVGGSKPVASSGGLEQSLAVLADTTAERYPLQGSVNRIVLVVGRKDRAVLTLDGLGAAAPGTTYRAWVVPPGTAIPVAGASFDASTPVVPLTRRVAKGARVAVTLEPATGAVRPSRPLRLVAVRG